MAPLFVLVGAMARVLRKGDIRCSSSVRFSPEPCVAPPGVAGTEF